MSLQVERAVERYCSLSERVRIVLEFGLQQRPSRSSPATMTSWLSELYIDHRLCSVLQGATR